MNLIETLRQLEVERPSSKRSSLEINEDAIALLPRLLDLCEKQHEALRDVGAIEPQPGPGPLWYAGEAHVIGWVKDRVANALALYNAEIEP